MSDGPRDAERLGLTSQYAQEVAARRVPMGYEQQPNLLGITKADASRILSRYAPLHIEDLSENELDLVLKLKRFAGE